MEFWENTILVDKPFPNTVTFYGLDHIDDFSEEFYINGRKEGICRQLRDFKTIGSPGYANGRQIVSEGSFIGGKREGKHLGWHYDGEIEHIYFYNKDVLAKDRCIAWDTNGNSLSHALMFSDEYDEYDDNI